MNENPQILDKTKILTTTSRRILFDCLLKGMLIKDAAKKANLGYEYARKLSANGHINALALQTRAEISAKNDITVESLQSNLLEVAQKAYSKGSYSASVQAYATLLKSIGGFTENRPNPAAIATKDAKREEMLRMIADRVYAELYLARPVDSVTVLDLRPLAGSTVEDNTQEGQNVQGQEQAAGSEQSGESSVQG